MSKQPKTEVPSDADLKGNPMIGGSKGATAAGMSPDDLEDAQGETTIEGDTLNGTNAQGGLNKKQGADWRK